MSNYVVKITIGATGRGDWCGDLTVDGFLVEATAEEIGGVIALALASHTRTTTVSRVLAADSRTDLGDEVAELRRTVDRVTATNRNLAAYSRTVRDERDKLRRQLEAVRAIVDREPIDARRAYADIRAALDGNGGGQ